MAKEKKQSALQKQEAKAFENAKIAYLLFLGSIFVPPLSVAALVIAYVRRKEAVDIAWLHTHYEYLIHTFWKGVAMFVGILVLMVILHIIAFAYLGLAYWVGMRCINGMKALSARRAVEDPRTWKF